MLCHGAKPGLEWGWNPGMMPWVAQGEQEQDGWAGCWARATSWASLLKRSRSKGSAGVGAARFNELLMENSLCSSRYWTLNSSLGSGSHPLLVPALREKEIMFSPSFRKVLYTERNSNLISVWQLEKIRILLGAFPFTPFHSLD